MVVVRFRYYPRRWENLAHGAMIENLRSDRSRYLQVVPFFLAEAWAVRRAVRSFRPDIAHVHWLVPQGVVMSACARRVPSVVTTLGGDLYALDGPGWRALKRWVVSRASAVTVMNEQMRAAVSDLGASPRNVHVLPMGVDVSAFSGTRPGSKRGPLRLLFVGRLVEKKGLGVLLDALAQCSVDARLTVVGDGPLRRSLEDRAAGLPVTFVGQQGRPRLAELYLEHDVAVTSSVLAASGDQDGLPVALLEAMASGCAIVASDLPGINEAVVNGKSGLLVPAGDVGSLRTALERLGNDQALLDELGIGARTRAAAFSVERRGEEYSALLRDVLAAASRRPED